MKSEAVKAWDRQSAAHWTKTVKWKLNDCLEWTNSNFFQYYSYRIIYYIFLFRNIVPVYYMFLDKAVEKQHNASR